MPPKSQQPFDATEMTPVPKKPTPSSKARRKKEAAVDEKRVKFLERNRAAATRCRERKKQWRQELLQKENTLETANKQMHDEMKRLREEIALLKNVLVAKRGPNALAEAGIQLSEYSDPSFDIDSLFTTTRVEEDGSAQASQDVPEDTEQQEPQVFPSQQQQSQSSLRPSDQQHFAHISAQAQAQQQHVSSSFIQLQTGQPTSNPELFPSLFLH
eukprot:m.46395 g.46395  ORF g.46395 m.46395 type:complete len:214 (+) comp12245_c0_seq1:124-765(+)